MPTESSSGASELAAMGMGTGNRDPISNGDHALDSEDDAPHSCSQPTSKRASEDGGDLLRLAQTLNTCGAKLGRFMALVEEVVDADYMVARSSSSSNSNSNSNSSSDSNTASLWRDRWLRVRPSFRPELMQSHDMLEKVQDQLHAEAVRLRCLIPSKKPSSSAIKKTTSGKGSSSSSSAAATLNLEVSDVHGPHLRVTKTQSAAVLRALTTAKQQYTVLSTQKAGTLFVTPKVGTMSSFCGYPGF